MTDSKLRRLAVTMRELEDGLAEVEAALKKAPNLTMTVLEMMFRPRRILRFES